MPLALSTISPSKKLEPSAETARRNLSEPKRPSSALVDEPGLQGQPEIVAGGLLVHGVEEIAGPALGHGLRGPERGVELRRERIARRPPWCRCRAATGSAAPTAAARSRPTRRRPAARPRPRPRPASRAAAPAASRRRRPSRRRCRPSRPRRRWRRRRRCSDRRRPGFPAARSGRGRARRAAPARRAAAAPRCAVTCFCAWLASRYGSRRWVLVSGMGASELRG